MSIFGMDSKLYKFMSKLTDVVTLNFLWLLFSLPVVTVGVSTIAACSAAMKMSEDKEGSIAKEFIRAFKQNIGQGVVMSFISLISAWAVYIDVQLTEAAEDNVILFVIVTAVAIYVLGFSQLYVYPLLARYRNTVFGSLKNSFSISMKFFLRTVILLIVTAVELLLIFWNETTLFAGILIGPALIIYTVSGMSINIFRELEKLPDTTVDRTAEAADDRDELL